MACPQTKNVARAPVAASRSRICSVQSDGPSSKESATRGAPTSWRLSINGGSNAQALVSDLGQSAGADPLGKPALLDEGPRAVEGGPPLPGSVCGTPPPPCRDPAFAATGAE